LQGKASCFKKLNNRKLKFCLLKKGIFKEIFSNTLMIPQNHFAWGSEMRNEKVK
jgi:hypothetical protein